MSFLLVTILKYLNVKINLTLFFLTLFFCSNLKSQSTVSTIIQTPTNKVEQSFAFYQKLNYEVVSKENPALVSNGKVLIEINPDRYARAGVKMYKESWKEEVVELEKLTSIHQIDGGHLLNDLTGCWIYLMEGESPYGFSAKESSFGLTGNFMGLSLEATDIKKSFKIWEILGFSTTMGDPEKSFVAMANAEGFGVSLMNPNTCPHLFFNPSMTFFNGEKNLGFIDQIRKTNIPITEEIDLFNDQGIVDNIIIRDPGGYGFFLFSD